MTKRDCANAKRSLNVDVKQILIDAKGYDCVKTVSEKIAQLQKPTF